MAATVMRMVRGADGVARHVPGLHVVASAPVRGRKKRVVPDPMRTNGESAAEQLRLLIERAERLGDEIKDLQDGLTDVFAEAKSLGFDVKGMREIIAIRRMERDAFIEQRAIVDLYRDRLGMGE